MPCTVFPPPENVEGVNVCQRDTNQRKGSSSVDLKKLPPMLSQCLGSTKRRHVKQEDKEKGMLEYAEEHSASGNFPESKIRSSVLC